MVLNEAVAVLPSRLRDRAAPVAIRPRVLRTGQRGVQQHLIPQTAGSAELRQAPFVQQKPGPLADPPRLRGHSARALNVSRYSFMSCRPALSCSATVGSYGVSRDRKSTR